MCLLFAAVKITCPAETCRVTASATVTVRGRRVGRLTARAQTVTAADGTVTTRTATLKVRKLR